MSKSCALLRFVCHKRTVYYSVCKDMIIFLEMQIIVDFFIAISKKIKLQ
jgi:hypothetical protein